MGELGARVVELEGQVCELKNVKSAYNSDSKAHKGMLDDLRRSLQVSSKENREFRAVQGEMESELQSLTYEINVLSGKTVTL